MGQIYIYLEVNLYMQMCRKHKKIATDVEIIGSSIYEQLAQEFIKKVVEKFAQRPPEEVKKVNPEIETEE